MPTKYGEFRSEGRACGQVAADKLKVKERDDGPKGVEVPLALFKQPDRFLGKTHLGGKLPLGSTFCLACGLEVFPQAGNGRTFAQGRALSAPNPVESFINVSLKWRTLED